MSVESLTEETRISWGGNINTGFKSTLFGAHGNRAGGFVSPVRTVSGK